MAVQRSQTLNDHIFIQKAGPILIRRGLLVKVNIKVMRWKRFAYLKKLVKYGALVIAQVACCDDYYSS